MPQSSLKPEIDKLYEDAASRGLDYGFLLLRVVGIEHFDGDPLVALREQLRAGTATQEDIDNCKDFWVLLINLARLNNKEQYSPFPLNTPLGAPEITDYATAAMPMLGGGLAQLVTQAREQGQFVQLATQLLDGYAQAFSDFFSVNPRYIRDGQFTVTEFYFDEEGAGLRAHHSNGTMSTFKRTETKADSINLAPGESVGYFVGMADELKREWLINGEPMYKALLHGKYNQDGEWKPIVYTGDTSIPQNAALAFSENWDVQAIFYYMYATGFPVIEFVLRTKIELPDEKTVFDNGVALLKLETSYDQLKNEHIYDGWLRFEDLTEEGILNALDTVRLTLEGLAFAFGAETTWQLKYKLHGTMRGVATPNANDMKKVGDLITAVNDSADKDQLMAAISWFNLGSRSQNPIIAFVCYYTAIEALARQLAEGKLEASDFFKPKGTSADEKEMLAAYDKLFDDHYPADIKKLLSKGYFEIHETLNRAVKNAFEAVYGTEHGAYKTMFANKDGLVGLRGSIVHEGYSEWDRQQYAAARKRLGEMHDIAHSFIIRVARQVPRGSKLPVLSGRFKHSADASHPNGVLVVSTLKMLPNETWEIRPEWLD